MIIKNIQNSENKRLREVDSTNQDLLEQIMQKELLNKKLQKSSRLKVFMSLLQIRFLQARTLSDVTFQI